MYLYQCLSFSLMVNENYGHLTITATKLINPKTGSKNEQDRAVSVIPWYIPAIVNFQTVTL